MRSFYLLHNLLHYQHDTSHNLKLLYWLYALRAAVFTYLAVFLPFYYLQDFINLGFNNQTALILTMLVFLIFQFANILGSFWAAFLSRKTSVKKTLWLSVLVLMGTTIMLSVRKDSLVIFLSGIGFGLHSGLWWITYHLEFVLAGLKKEYGKQVGIRQALGIASGALLTLFAGLIINRFGFSYMYLFTTLLLIIMLIIVNLLEDHELKALPFKFIEMKQVIKKFPADFALYFSVGAEGFVAEIVWPLLLFVVFTQPLTVGIIAALVTLVAFAVRIVAGIWMDNHQQQQEFKKLGIFTVSLIYLGKALSQYPLSLVFFDSLHRIFTTFYYLPAVTLNYFRSLTENKTVYILSRELVGLFGKITALVIAILLLALEVNVWYLLLIGVFSPLISLLIKNPLLRK